jgi:hypothetical protein
MSPSGRLATSTSSYLDGLADYPWRHRCPSSRCWLQLSGANPGEPKDWESRLGWRVLGGAKGNAASRLNNQWPSRFGSPFLNGSAFESESGSFELYRNAKRILMRNG